MIKQAAKNSIQAGLKYLTILILSLVCQQAFAVIDDLKIECEEPTGIDKTYDLETCRLTEGEITNTSIVELTADLMMILDATPGVDYSPAGSDCSIIDGVVSCQLGAFDIEMGCTIATDANNNRSVTCELKTDPDAEPFFQMGCSHEENGCNVHTDSETLLDLVKAQLPTGEGQDNLSGLADSLLTCVSRNTFDSFQNVCDKIISTLQQPGGAEQVAAFIESIQPLNPDA